MFLGKDTLNSIKVQIFKDNSCISHEEFISVNNMLRKYNEMEEEIKNTEIYVEYAI